MRYKFVRKRKIFCTAASGFGYRFSLPTYKSRRSSNNGLIFRQLFKILDPSLAKIHFLSAIWIRSSLDGCSGSKFSDHLTEISVLFYESWLPQLNEASGVSIYCDSAVQKNHFYNFYSINISNDTSRNSLTF